MMEQEPSIARQKMVDEQLKERGIQDQLVLASFSSVPRHLFVPDSMQFFAYYDSPLPIGEGQTISQPFIVALMLQMAALTKQARVLDIGTGSGYSAALLSQIAAEVYTIERIESLAQAAQKRFDELHYANIALKVGDGTLGWPEKAPFDAIFVAAGAPVVPQALFDQLNERGRLIIPVGDRLMQELRCYQKIQGQIQPLNALEWVRFVPLVGEQGWPAQ